MKKILILTLCFLMCFITLTPTAFAKCSHKNTKWETLQEATCTKAGKRVKLCTKCGKSLKTERIKKKNHTLKRYIKKATCTSNGLNWERCSRCNYTHVLNKIPAKGHAFGVTHYGASCTAPEMTIKTCERCDISSSTGIPAGQMSWHARDFPQPSK